MSERLRILHIISGLRLGGAESMLARLVNAMDHSAFDHRIVSLSGEGELGQTIAASGTPVEPLDVNHVFAAAVAILRIRESVRHFRPHVIHGWLYHGNLMALLSTIPAVGSSVICSLHHARLDSAHDKSSTIAVAKLGAWLSRRSDVIISCSESGARFHAEFGYPPEKIRVIPNGFDLSHFSPDPLARRKLREELDLPPQSKLIGMVGRFSPVKNHAEVLEAARLLLGWIPPTDAPYFTLCGSGVDHSNAMLQGLIKQLGLEERVILLGQRDDMPSIYSALDVVASCSLSEAFPLSVGEAMSCGALCAVRDVGDSSWIVGDAGRVVPAGGPARMAEVWRELLELPLPARDSLSRRARCRIQEHFPLPSMLQRYEHLYHELADALPNSEAIVRASPSRRVNRRT